jgi:nucleoside-diphosphate-sugar epimerase
MRILITGGAGYIGSVLTKKLLNRGYAVRAVDSLRHGCESIYQFYKNPAFEFIKGDLRDDRIQRASLEGIGAVFHLAAIVGDPACKKEPKLAEEINWMASKALFDNANEIGIRRFIFASTCSNYGKMVDTEQYVDETGVLNPISWYAELKVRFEQYLLEAPVNSMVTTSLRFATAYGVSPRMRFDLTVNEFVKDAFLGRKLKIYGKKFWRPYCHVEDLAQAGICVLETDRNLVDREVFNVGDTSENYQKNMIADLIKERLPGMRVGFIHKDEDPRDYRVDFNKIKDKLKFQTTKRVKDGIDEVIKLLGSGLIKDPDSTYYKNT